MLVACTVGVLIVAIPTAILSALWFSNQQPLWKFTAYGTATSVATSSDGSYVAVGIEASVNPSMGQVVLLNRAGSVLWAHSSSLITAVAIAADGSRIAATGLVTNVISTGPTASFTQTGTVSYYDQNGSLLWNYSTPLNEVDYPGSGRPPMLNVMVSQDGGRVVLDTGTGTIVLDSLGRLLWSYTPTCSSTLCPWITLASANASFIVNINDEIHAFDGKGVSLWNSTILSRHYFENGIMSKDGKLLALEWYDVGLNPRPTLALLDNSGVELWNRTLNGVTVTPTISNDDSAIVMSPSGRVAAIDPQNRVLWNSTQAPGNLIITTLHGSYTAAVVALDLGNNMLRILDSTGRAVWGYGDFGDVEALALSCDDSFLAVAAGPYTSYSSNSAIVVFLPGPRTLATQRGPTYAWFTFDPNTQNTAWLFLLPAIPASASFLYLHFRSKSKVQGLGPSQPTDEKTEGG